MLWATALNRQAAFLSATVSLFTMLAGATCPLPASAQFGGTPMAINAAATRTALVDGSGSLAAIFPGGKAAGKCALKHTTVSAKVSGYMARVSVKQLFTNPYKEKIEAVYTFPLSESGAVDDMVMRVGSRTIRGTIMKRDDARVVYEQARQAGNVASLLDQERPNIFTQSVANIEPGKDIEVEISYVDILPYESGKYTFAFPTVVGPRFSPFRLTRSAQSALRDAMPQQPVPQQLVARERLKSYPAAKGTRSGHDISISVDIDTAVPATQMASAVHDISVAKIRGNHVLVELKDQAAIPNRDFVLSWNVGGEKIASGYLTHKLSKNGYLTCMIVPPARVAPRQAAPKEMIFLVDRSGSQGGQPLEKCKETLSYILDNMNPNDTFQIVSFSDRIERLFDKPKTATANSRAQAKRYIKGLTADGGTFMGPAVEQICAMPQDSHRLRIVTFMTDGYVDNDMEVLGLVRKLRGTSRWFSFGTGYSVNRFLIDGIAREGGGEADYVLLNRPGKEVAKSFYERISSPVLTDVKVSFEGITLKDVFPRQVSDVWAEKPLYIKARYTKPGQGKIKIDGFAGGKPYHQELAVDLPGYQPDNPAVASVWARALVDGLMSEDWFRAQIGLPKKEIKDEIVQVALAHHLMTQYTSFVAVDQSTVTKGRLGRTEDIAKELPEGVNYTAVFDEPVSPQPGTEIEIAPVVGPQSLNAPPTIPRPVPSPQPVQIINEAPTVAGGMGQPIDIPAYPSPEPTAPGAQALPPPSLPSSSPTPPMLTGGFFGGDAMSAGDTGTMIRTAPAGASIEAAQPLVQGATNGTIGPQYGDATVVEGINTSGAFAPAPAGPRRAWHFLATALNVAALVFGLVQAAIGILLAFSDKAEGVRRAAFAAGWLVLLALYMPLLVPYGLIWWLCARSRGRSTREPAVVAESLTSAGMSKDQ